MNAREIKSVVYISYSILLCAAVFAFIIAANSVVKPLAQDYSSYTASVDRLKEYRAMSRYDNKAVNASDIVKCAMMYTKSKDIEIIYLNGESTVLTHLHTSEWDTGELSKEILAKSGSGTPSFTAALVSDSGAYTGFRFTQRGD